jgi:Transposase, Mutator family
MEEMTVRGPAEEAVDRLLEQGFLDDLTAKVDEGAVQLTGEGGFLPELVKRVLEAGLQAELTDHLGYEKHDRAGHGSGNSRNGSIPKRLAPRSAILIWRRHGIVTAASSRSWCRRAPAGSAASRT